MMKNESDIVQIKNPVTGRYVKVERRDGRIADHKSSNKPYKNIPILRKRKD